MLTRLAMLQGLSLAMLGAVFPYLALELQDRQVSGLALTVAMTATPALRLLLGPAWGLLSDRVNGATWVVMLAAGMALGGCLALLGLPPALALLGVLALGIGRTGSGPLVDGLTLTALKDRADDYGRVRLWGSVGFLIAAFGAGWGRDKGLSPLWLGSAAGLGMLVVAASLPKAAAPTGPRRRLLPALLSLGRDPGFLLLLLASGLHFAGHAVYDSFFSVHIDAQGHDSLWVGVAVILGVGVEVGVLALGPRLLARFGSHRLLLGAMLLALPRWVLSAWTDSLPLTIALQAVHGITFGAFWVAGVSLVQERAPKDLRTSGLGLLSAAVGGVGSGLGNLGGSLIVDSGADTHWLFAFSASMSSLAILAALACLRALRAPAVRAQV